MLKKIIATAMSFAMLANSSMIVVSAAEDSNADNSFVTGIGEDSIPMETTTASADVSVETTTSNDEEMTLKDIGRDVRKDLEVQVGDVIYFDEEIYLKDNHGDLPIVRMGDRVWVISADDENQRYRVFVPKFCTMDSGIILYLSYEKTKIANIETHDGLIIGDLDFDRRTDVFDLCLMRRGFIYGWENAHTYTLADMNTDGEVTIADLVYLQRWLLGAIQ